MIYQPPLSPTHGGTNLSQFDNLNYTIMNDTIMVVDRKTGEINVVTKETSTPNAIYYNRQKYNAHLDWAANHIHKFGRL
jgi:hypothetical protein